MIEIVYRTVNRKLCRTATLVLVVAVLSMSAFAQASPWENAVTQLQTSFTGPIARGLSLVAIVIGGLMFAYSEGAAKKTFAGILFGCGAALAANNFMTWLFP
jgi:type IV secretory pathway VirB2 component (pilin)